MQHFPQSLFPQDVLSGRFFLKFVMKEQGATETGELLESRHRHRGTSCPISFSLSGQIALSNCGGGRQKERQFIKCQTAQGYVCRCCDTLVFILTTRWSPSGRLDNGRFKLAFVLRLPVYFPFHLLIGGQLTS